MTYENILIDIKDSIAIVTINRPDKLNALNQQTIAELYDVFQNIKADNKVSVTILTGSGEKAFVAGADIKELNKLNGVAGKEFAANGQFVFNYIEKLGKPVIAAVNGFALGGGCELSMACHIRLASEKAKFGQPEVNLGVIPGFGGTQRLPRLINTGRAMELLLTGDMIDADEAYRLGIVSKVFAHDELMANAWAMAEKIASKGQIAIRMVTDTVVSCNETSEAEGQKLEAGLFGLCCGSEDFEEGTNAFLEKRKPEFKNK